MSQIMLKFTETPKNCNKTTQRIQKDEFNSDVIYIYFITAETWDKFDAQMKQLNPVKPPEV